MTMILACEAQAFARYTHMMPVVRQDEALKGAKLVMLVSLFVR